MYDTPEYHFLGYPVYKHNMFKWHPADKLLIANFATSQSHSWDEIDMLVIENDTTNTRVLFKKTKVSDSFAKYSVYLPSDKEKYGDIGVLINHMNV